MRLVEKSKLILTNDFFNKKTYVLTPIYSAYKTELAEINEKIEKAKAELLNIENKITENTKLVEGRMKLINELESNLTMIRLEITEIQSVEFPQEADVEVMVSYTFFKKKNVIN